MVWQPKFPFKLWNDDKILNLKCLSCGWNARTGRNGCLVVPSGPEEDSIHVESGTPQPKKCPKCGGEIQASKPLIRH